MPAAKDTPEQEQPGRFLSPEDARKVQQAIVANILKKVQQGKSLSPQEQAVLDAQTQGQGTNRLPYYDSMQLCAVATGIPLSVIKKAKREGCDAFKGSRVYLELLLRWIFRADKTKELLSFEDERTRETRARADLLEIKTAQKRRELVPLSEIQTMLRDAFLPVRQRLLSLPAEWAHRVNPTDPAFGHEALQRWVDESFPIIRAQLPQRGSTEENEDESRPL